MKIDGPFYAQLGDAAGEARRLAEIGYEHFENPRRALQAHPGGALQDRSGPWTG